MSDLEIVIFFIMIIMGFVFLVSLSGDNNSDKSKQSTKRIKKKLVANSEKIRNKHKKDLEDISIVESFDYMGTKIINNDGNYTIIDKDKTFKYSSYSNMPYEYQKMLIEMDKQRNNGNENSYIMETINGQLYVHFPNGRKKKFKNYSDIPLNIRTIMENK